MVFDDIKVGDQYYDKHRNLLLTVTELTANGFAYTHPPYNMFPVRWGLDPVTSGELFYKLHTYLDWDLWYDKVNTNEPTNKTTGLCADSNYGQPIAQEKCPVCLGTGLRANSAPNCS